MASRLLLGLVAALLCALVVAEGSVKIEVLHQPENCDDFLRATEGDKITMDYKTSIGETQEVIDDTARRGDPITILLSSDTLLPGVMQGIVGMCQGERRRVTIPPELAFGDVQAGPVPPNSTLVFEVDLIEVQTDRKPLTQRIQENAVSTVLIYAPVIAFTALMVYVFRHFNDANAAKAASNQRPRDPNSNSQKKKAKLMAKYARPSE